MNEIKEYDKKGNLIHYRGSNGYEWWREVDEKGNEIHYRDSNGYEYWREYDAKNNCIHCRYSDGFEYWSEYDENSNTIHIRDTSGYEKWYDEKENKIEKPTTPTQEHTKMSDTITLMADCPNYAELTLSIPADCQITDFLEHCKTLAIGMGFHHSNWDEAILEHAQTIKSINAWRD